MKKFFISIIFVTFALLSFGQAIPSKELSNSYKQEIRKVKADLKQLEAAKKAVDKAIKAQAKADKAMRKANRKIK
jgi:hypothetical protein